MSAPKAMRVGARADIKRIIMKFQGTKGEWAVSAQADVIQIVTANLIIGEVYDNASRKIDKDTCLNNARLMASAPVLLKALESIRGIEAHINDNQMKSLFQKTVYPAIEKAVK